MIALWICVVIGILVFGAMAYAMFKFRKSKGAVAAQFSHNTTAEIIWTVVPIVMLVVMAWPATAKLITMYDTRDAEMTVKVTGYQWMWKYEYLGEDVEFTSRLDRESDRIRQSRRAADAAKPTRTTCSTSTTSLVLPIDTKIRFVITADDVIHAWWVPALGWKQDAIPGIVNEAWTDIQEPGHLPRPVRRAVRQGPRLHADRGQGRAEGGVPAVAGVARRPSTPRPPAPAAPRRAGRRRAGRHRAGCSRARRSRPATAEPAKPDRRCRAADPRQLVTNFLR